MESNLDIQKLNKHKIKIVFLGDRAVGKSSIISKFALNKFNQHSQATIGVDFISKLCKYNATNYKLQLWDTAGQEKYRSLIKGYLRGANACVFVYDQSNPQSYQSLYQWIKTFQDVSTEQNTYVTIFGNKSDIAKERTEMDKVRKIMLKQFPKIQNIPQFQGSAKTGHNIQQIFEQILQNYQQKNYVKAISNKSIGQTLISNFKKQKSSSKNIPCCIW